MTLVRRWVAVAVVVPLLVAGCSDDPEPTFEEPTESPSPTETTSEPEAWEVRSEAGAVAFAEHWIDEFSASMKDGDTSALSGLSSDDCETCTNVAARVNSIYSSGGTYESKGWRVLEASAADGTPRNQAVVAMRVLRSAEVFREAAGSPKQRNPASKAALSAHLRWADGRWLMQRLDLVG